MKLLAEKKKVYYYCEDIKQWIVGEDVSSFADRLFRYRAEKLRDPTKEELTLLGFSKEGRKE